MSLDSDLTTILFPLLQDGEAGNQGDHELANLQDNGFGNFLVLFNSFVLDSSVFAIFNLYTKILLSEILH